jgi:hypothetical protein
VRHSSSTLSALVAAGLALSALPFAACGADPIAAPSGEQPVKPAADGAARIEAPRRALDRFVASTTAMSPSDVELRFDLLRWSDDAGRAAVVAALGEADPTAVLAKLPTLGYVWLSSSPVGFSVKYAHRTPAADGGERITFVTDQRLDAREFRKWAPTPPLAAKDTGYGVIELYLDAKGNGTGTFSLAADVKVDEASSSVSLEDGAPRLLANAKVQPKPYWERAGESSTR